MANTNQMADALAILARVSRRIADLEAGDDAGLERQRDAARTALAEFAAGAGVTITDLAATAEIAGLRLDLDEQLAASAAGAKPSGRTRPQSD